LYANLCLKVVTVRVFINS